MKIVGLTGGIGSGKTTVAGLFKELGAPVYIADVEAKKLSNSSKIIRRKLIQLLGEKAYTHGGLNRKFVADKIFKDPILLKSVNEIIHPKVAQHFKRWVKRQNASYCIKEAAILFENGEYINCDLNILVVAPKAERIRRVIQRDATTKEAVLERMSHQWSDAKKQKLADFVIKNQNLESTQKQVQKIHNTLIRKGI
ncbi:MAG: dephospho-CoA kinase [Altibacter sp.]|uniref:dephospho-CoA kinase n=1 Tax=Altibacter sp. TaxID=2024823 RepID=UPI001D3DE916|nr:dephospho-CoA kinase [Altibacter sp.]MBZ0326465.1 dephospho-CoA kinase [Altibacter sp.]